MKKLLNLALLASFLITILAPLTGIIIHKLASTLFLLLSVIHTIVCRRKLGMKRYLLLAVVILTFLTGIFGLILDAYPVVLALHKAISIAAVFFLAIHISVYHRRMR